MSTDDDSNTGLVLALVGAAAAFAWLVWRGRGAGKAGRENGERSEPAHEVVIQIYGGDRLSVNGTEMGLAAAVERARHATLVDIYPLGDARHGWIEQVQAALQAAGVHFVLYPLPHRTPQP
jgi:outer membrane PBP1 activator LpoA protein